MQLSDLVRLKNSLSQEVIDKQVITFLDEKLTHLKGIINGLAHSSEHNKLLIEYVNEVEYLKKRYLALTSFPGLTNYINGEISEITKNWADRGYQINGAFATNKSNVEFERTGRVMLIEDESREIVSTRTRAYTNWKYPTLEIGPGDGQWTSDLVAGDPLYLVDIEQEFLDSAIRQFTPEFQRRVRTYKLDWARDTDVSMLPHNQFGFVFSWNVFNYFPENMIKDYLTQIYTLLRDGGVCMFSYNNCDRYHSAKFAEEGVMSWITKDRLINLANTIGYEIVYTADLETSLSWIEIKKPGILSTIKTHQALGEINYL